MKPRNNIPDFRVHLGDRDLTDKLRPRLMSLSIIEKRGDEADQLDLVLDDSRGDIPLPAAGATLRVQLGWLSGADVQPGLVDKGSFVVDEVEHSGPPDIVTIRAHAADFTGALTTRREHSWHDTTLSAVLAALAGRNGLTARIAPALAAIAVPALAQSRESDLAFLRRLGRQHDAVATIKQGLLIFSRKGAGVTPTGGTIPPLTLHRREGDSHRFRIEKREEATGITASWHDRRGAKRESVTVGDQDGAKRLRKVYPNETAAREAAIAAQARAGRQPRSLELTLALGRADLYPERPLLTSGFRSEIDHARWLVEEVTHSLSKDRGYIANAKLEAE
nr:contractile injection system protein, VgrG/Pvc8 family [uncultured Sphingomonas sp.]